MHSPSYFLSIALEDCGFWMDLRGFVNSLFSAYSEMHQLVHIRMQPFTSVFYCCYSCNFPSNSQCLPSHT